MLVSKCPNVGAHRVVKGTEFGELGLVLLARSPLVAQRSFLVAQGLQRLLQHLVALQFALLKLEDPGFVTQGGDRLQLHHCLGIAGVGVQHEPVVELAQPLEGLLEAGVEDSELD